MAIGMAIIRDDEVGVTLAGDVRGLMCYSRGQSFTIDSPYSVLIRISRIIDDAIYAMVDGNVDGEPVPIGVVDEWLKAIKSALG